MMLLSVRAESSFQRDIVDIVVQTMYATALVLELKKMEDETSLTFLEKHSKFILLYKELRETMEKINSIKL